VNSQFEIPPLGIVRQSTSRLVIRTCAVSYITPGQHVCQTNELVYSRIDWTVHVPSPRRCRPAFVRVVLDQSFPCCAVLRLILPVIHPRNPDLHPRLMMGRHLPTPLALLVLDRFTILIQSLLLSHATNNTNHASREQPDRTSNTRTVSWRLITHFSKAQSLSSI